jgi:hypothetical protein
MRVESHDTIREVFPPPLKMRRVAKNLQCKTTRKKSRGYNTLTTRGRATPSNSERNQIN